MSIKPVVIGDATLYQGDCIEIISSIKYFDAIITDPPYALPTTAAKGWNETRTLGDLSIMETTYRIYFDEFVKKLSTGARLFVFCDSLFYPILFRVFYRNYKLALIVWDKNRVGIGREFKKSHELIIHCWTRKTLTYKFLEEKKDVIRCPFVNPTDRKHPAEKPVDLLKALIEPCGETIFDPFMGSGSCGVAALNMGKKFIGIEIEPQYFDIACANIESAWKNKQSSFSF